MKLTDFVAKFLARCGIDTVFGVTGGAVVHLFDSAAQNNIRCIFTHHEQAAAFAAQAYARVRGIGAGFFTTGPGGTNGVTGVAAAWLDSIPTLYIGGQVRKSHLKPPGLRQRGTQELDNVAIFSPIVKYAKTLLDPSQIRYELEKCLDLATSGRPGPVYLEIPLELQWAEVDESSLAAYQKGGEGAVGPEEEAIQALFQALMAAKRPLLLLGHGIRLAKGEIELEEFLERSKIPYVTTWNASDLVDGDDPLNLGRPGMFGCRSANLAVQAADFLCCLGSHLPLSVTTSSYESFAKQAEVAVVNIDNEELKHQIAKVKYPILGDVKRALQALSRKLGTRELRIEAWKERCRYLSANFIRHQGKRGCREGMDAYFALSELDQRLIAEDSIVIDGGGTIVQIAFQTLKIKKGQRVVIDGGLCSMGSGFPQAIGVAYGRSRGRIICLCGDGSFQFNVQELQTIVHHQLPVKMFIFNNGGYLSIRHTQAGFLGGRFIGSDREGGISIPEIEQVAKAYCIPYFSAEQEDALAKALEETLATKGPALCEIRISTEQQIQPRIGFDEKEKGRFVARPMEDMWPYLSKEDLEKILNPALLPLPERVRHESL